ncbi:MAG TPA: transglutaminase-like domain-containing protein, partial [Rhizobium sp.]
AVLFAEAVRCLGFGARIVSGYLFNPDRILLGSQDQGSTHAWVEVFVPGPGWITFDPTNRSMGEANLIPAAVAYRIGRLLPSRCSAWLTSRVSRSGLFNVPQVIGHTSDCSCIR